MRRLNIIPAWYRRDPFRVIEDMNNQLSLLEDSDFTSTGISMNLYEEDGKFIAEIPTPGLKPEDINISVDDRHITISGQNKFENKEEGRDRKYLVMEVKEMSFSRTFTLPDKIDGDNIEAEIKDGMLHIEIPKAQRSESKKIQIKAS